MGGSRSRGLVLRVGQLDAAEAELGELTEELDGALAAAFAGVVVVGADEESPDEVAGVEDAVPADTVDFDFERESLR